MINLIFQNVLTIIFVYSFSSISFSQVDVNVDLSEFKESWFNQYLKTTQFSNGESLTVINENFDNFVSEKWRKANIANQPCVLITKNQEYLYNFHAIERGQLAPLGYRIASIDDFKNRTFQFEEVIFNKKTYASPLKIERTDYFIDEIFENDYPSQRIWCSDVMTSKIEKEGLKANEYAYVYVFDFDSENKTGYFNETYKNNGFPILLIEDLNYKLKNNIFEYNLILPTETIDLYKSLANQFKEIKNLRTGSYNFTKLLSFNGIGKNTSSENTFKSSYNDTNLITKIDGLINNWSDYPTYKGQPLNSELKVKIEYFNFPSNKKIIRNYGQIKATELQNKSTFSNLDKYKIVLEQYDLALNFNSREHTIMWSEYRIVNLKAKSYFNAIKSIYGGGYHSISKHYNSSNRYKSKTMRGFIRVLTPTFGSLAVISYFSRKHYYENYLSSINKNAPSNNDYKMANAFQKAFLGSLLIYTSTSIFDFCWTINEVKSNKRNKKFVMSNIERFYSGN